MCALCASCDLVSKKCSWLGQTFEEGLEQLQIILDHAEQMVQCGDQTALLPCMNGFLSEALERLLRAWPLIRDDYNEPLTRLWSDAISLAVHMLDDGTFPVPERYWNAFAQLLRLEPSHFFVHHLLERLRAIDYFLHRIRSDAFEPLTVGGVYAVSDAFLQVCPRFTKKLL